MPVYNPGEGVPPDDFEPLLLAGLLPKRNPPWGVLATAAGVTALLLAAYRGLGAPQPLWIRHPLPPFGLEGPGNLASWISSLVLTTSGIFSFLIWWLYQIGDERRGRIWLAAAVWYFYLGIDESAGIHLAIGPILQEFFGATNPASPWWWMVPYSFIFCAILSRLVVDIRYSGWASFFMTVAVLLYGAAGLVQSGLVPEYSLPTERILAEELPELLGHWCLLLSVLSFGHFILRRELEAYQNLVPVDDLEANPSREFKGTQTPNGPSAQSYGQITPGDAVTGDYLIIHPPHGHGPPVAVPREVKRVTRRKTRTTEPTPRRRSDLDLPRSSSARTALPSGSEAVPVTASGGNTPSQLASTSSPGVITPPAAVPQPSGIAGAPTGTNMNAFLAGMAYAEARRLSQPLQTDDPQCPASGLGNFRAAVVAGEVQERAVAPTAVQPTGSRPGEQQGSGMPSQSGLNLPNEGASTARGRHSLAESNQRATQNVAMISGSSGITSGSVNLPQLPSRRLTKEEKKRLKQLYKQRMAQLEAQ